MTERDRLVPSPAEVLMEEATQAHEDARHESSLHLNCANYAATVSLALATAAMTAAGWYMGTADKVRLFTFPKSLKWGVLGLLIAAAAVPLLAQAVIIRSRYRYVQAINRIRLFRRYWRSAVANDGHAGNPSASWTRSVALAPDDDVEYHRASREWSSSRLAQVFLATLSTVLTGGAILWCTASWMEYVEWKRHAPWMLLGAAAFLVAIWQFQWHYANYHLAREDLKRHPVGFARRPEIRRLFCRSCRASWAWGWVCTVLTAVGTGLLLHWARAERFWWQVYSIVLVPITVVALQLARKEGALPCGRPAVPRSELDSDQPGCA